MLSICNFERMFYSCPEIDCADPKRFPEVSLETFLVMEQEFYADTSVAHIFPYVMMNDTGETYVDIYIWYVMLYPQNYKRFIIIDGWRLPQELENDFLKYIYSKSIQIDGSRLKIINRAVISHFPTWHYNDYSICDIDMAFEHMYFASHPSGVKEILYKSRLNNIAFRIDEIPSCNLIGTTPSTIIGHDLSIKLLRILNQPGFIDHLFNEDKIERCKAVYRAYSGYIGKRLPTISQWVYISKLYENDGVFAGHVFLRSLYDRLSMSWSECILEEYEKFLILRDEYSDIRKIKLPHPNDIGDAVEKLEMIEEYRNENEFVDEMIKARKKRSGYEYRGETYSVIMPNSSLDICKEAISQGNCVMDYIEDHASGETTILFIRKSCSVEKSFVTVEVKDWIIRQAYAKFNTLPAKDVYVFLMEYAKKKWLFCDPYKLITEDMNGCDDTVVDEDLMRFAEKHRYQTPIVHRVYPDDETFTQLTIADYFSETFQ